MVLVVLVAGLLALRSVMFSWFVIQFGFVWVCFIIVYLVFGFTACWFCGLHIIWLVVVWAGFGLFGLIVFGGFVNSVDCCFFVRLGVVFWIVLLLDFACCLLRFKIDICAWWFGI